MLKVLTVVILDFNPIIVLFLTFQLFYVFEQLDFNPIIVLFLTPLAVSQFLSIRIFQSYYSLIFNLEYSDCTT